LPFVDMPYVAGIWLKNKREHVFKYLNSTNYCCCKWFAS